MSEVIKPQFENVPESLQKYDQWIVWNAELITKKDGKQKLTKIPHDPKTGRKASTTKSSNWGSFDQAVNAYLFEGYSGIGFVFTPEDPFVGIDLDNCFDELGDLRQDAKVAVSTLNTFTEKSPSGKGLHLICEGLLPGSGHCDHVNGREMYQEGRFFTITADIVEGNSQIVDGSENLELLYDEWFGKAAYDEVESGDLNWDKKAEIVPLKQMPVSDYVKHLVSNGEGMNDFPDVDGSPDRSLAMFTVCREMVYARVNKESILRCLTDEDNYLSSAALERRKNIKSAIQWVWKYTLGKIVAQYELEKELLKDDDDIELADSDDDDLSGIDADLAELGLLDEPVKKKEKSADKSDLDIPYVKGDHELNARLFLKHNPIYYRNGFFYLYNGRCYAPVKNEELEGEVQSSMFGRKFPMATINNTITVIKRLATTRKFKERSNMIVFPNGVLDLNGWDAGRGFDSFKLLPHNKKYHVIGELDFEFDATALAPVFENFLDEVYESHPDSIELLLNYGGYLLVKDYRFQHILVMMGKSRSGKGTILNNIIPWVTGRMNYGATSLMSLANPHGLQSIVDKKVAVITEAKHGRKDTIAKSLEALLNISGNDAIPINPKNKDEFTDQLDARLIMACNELPKFSDGHNALANRYLILPHNVSFVDRVDPLLPKKLEKEKSGIFNCFLKGLLRLGKRGRFVRTSASQKQDIEIKKAQNPVGYFVDTYLVRTNDPSDRVTKSELYDDYISVANADDCPMREKNWFGRELINNADWIETGRMKDGSRANCYIGFKIKKKAIEQLMDDEL